MQEFKLINNKGGPAEAPLCYLMPCRLEVVRQFQYFKHFEQQA